MKPVVLLIATGAGSVPGSNVNTKTRFCQKEPGTGCTTLYRKKPGYI